MNSDIPELYYIDDIITDEYSNQLLQYLDNVGVWSPITERTNSRVVQQYGYKYNYVNRNNNMELAETFPEIFSQLISKLQQKITEYNISASTDFNQIIVNNYNPGQGINKHIDSKTFGSIIGCYTIGSGATMRFRRKDQIIDLYVKPNSLYIMSGESRYLWTHEMPSTKTDKINGVRVARDRRISITFRFVG